MTALSCVNIAINGRAAVRPISKKTAQLMTASTRPVVAAVFASSKFFAPSRRAISELTPTAVPTANEIITICSGYASDTAVIASGEYCATKMLSTTLYSACIIIENIAGSDIPIKSGNIGLVPILFCGA